MGRRLRQTVSKEDIQMAKKHMDDQNSNYYRNAYQNYSEVSPHTSQYGHHQKVYKQ